MAWHDKSPWRAKRLEQTHRMEQIAEIVQRFEQAAISAPMAIEKIREVLEPRIVKVGKTHTPEVKS
jgi:hypothetical protein